MQVKKLEDVGVPEDSCVVQGVAMRKALAHKRMRTAIEYPKVLLLAGSLEYQRDPNRLASFDNIDQDKQYLAAAVARLAVAKPDIVLVEKSVARMALEDLTARGISLVLGVKLPLLEQLARCMGVKVVPNLEHLTQQNMQTFLADCKSFKVESFPVGPPSEPPTPAHAMPAAAPAPIEEAAGSSQGGYQSLSALILQASIGMGPQVHAVVPPQGSGAAVQASPMQMQASPHASGAVRAEPCTSTRSHGHFYGSNKQHVTLIFFDLLKPTIATLLLKGAPGAELQKVKRVMRFAVFAAWAARLESAFLADQLLAAEVSRPDGKPDSSKP